MATKKSVRLCSCIPLLMLYACIARAQQLPASAGAVSGTAEAATGESPTQAAKMPVSAPRVSCKGNQLTIDAENSTLGSVLSAVHDCLGVEIVMPDGAADQRSYVRLGPGPTRDVLDELLSSTTYSYAIQSSSSAAGKISSILLMANSKDASDSQGTVPPVATDAIMTPARRAWMASVRTVKLAGTQPDTGGSGMGAAEPVTPSTSDAPPSAQTNPNATDSSAANVSPGTPDIGAPPASIQVPAASDSTQQPQSAGDLQNKIEQMQQLFEQRKKMAAAQGQPPG